MENAPPITFSLFVLSLAASAESHLGTLRMPGAEKPEAPNLTEAAHLIEVLAMLKEKTAGNLDESEDRLIGAILYDLRMRYVEVAKTVKSDVETDAAGEGAKGGAADAGKGGSADAATSGKAAGEP